MRPWNNRIKDKVRNHVAWGKGCLKLLSHLPKNANDFMDCIHSMDTGLHKLVGAMDDIKIAFKSPTLRKFIGCWPDEHHLLLKLLSDPNKGLHANMASQVGPGLERLEYKDQAELLSMRACLVDDWDAQTVLRQKGPGWIRRNWSELRRRLDAWYRRDGIYPHPRHFFLHCRDLN